jgi:hypothetical protein
VNDITPTEKKVMVDGLYTYRGKKAQGSSASKVKVGEQATTIFKTLIVEDTKKSERECSTASNVATLPEILIKYGNGLEDIFVRDESTNKILSSGTSTMAMCIVLELITRMTITDEGEIQYFSPYTYHSLQIQNKNKRG